MKFNLIMKGLVFLAFALRIVYGQDKEMDVKERVEMILFSHVRVGGTPTHQKLREYAQRSGVEMDVIHEILIDFAENTLAEDVDRRTYRLAIGSVSMLDRLSVTNALPLLRNITYSTTNALDRTTAMCAIINIGGTNMLDFAQEVFEQHDIFSRYDRGQLYRSLAPYVSISSVGTPPHKLEPDEYPEKRKLKKEVKEFLLWAIHNEPNDINLLPLDRILSLADKNYKNSIEREAFLQKIKVTGIERHKNYASNQLEELRAIPELQRTRIPPRIGVDAPD